MYIKKHGSDLKVPSKSKINDRYLCHFFYHELCVLVHSQFHSMGNLVTYVFINSDHKRIQECSISVKGRVICNQRCLESDQPGV